MQKPVRIAVIGAGRWGKNIIKTLKANPRCIVTAVETRGYKKLLKKKDVDAIVIATPGSTHAEIALPFVKRGLSVFIEKPFTLRVADAKVLLATAKKSGSRLCIGHVQLYNPAYQKTKELSKKIGAIRFLYGEGANNGPYRDDMSAIWDWAPHDVAAMCDLMGKRPTTVRAWGTALLRPKTKLYDAGFIELTFSSGVIGFIFNSWLFPEKRKSLTVVGTKSSIVFDDAAEKKIVLYKGMGPTVRTSRKIPRIIQKNPSVSHPDYASTLPLTEEMDSFVTMVTSKTKQKNNHKEALDVIEIIAAAEQSIEGGGSVVRI